jgi:hypothetical protein
MLSLIIIVMTFGLGFASGYLVRAEISHRRRMRVRQQRIWGVPPPYAGAVDERVAPFAGAAVIGGPLPRAGAVAECEDAEAHAHADSDGLSDLNAMASPGPQTRRVA